MREPLERDYCTDTVTRSGVFMNVPPIIAEPEATAVINPEVETVATLGALECQTTWLVMSIMLPSE